MDHGYVISFADLDYDFQKKLAKLINPTFELNFMAVHSIVVEIFSLKTTNIDLIVK